LDGHEAVVVRSVARANERLTLLEQSGEVEVRPPGRESAALLPNERAQAMLAASSTGSSQAASIERFQGALRSPKAVASSGTRAIAPASWRIITRPRSDGACVARSTIRSIASSSRRSR
jgi:hypothetical protein